MFTIEDGGGVVGANSYISVGDATDYLTLRYPSNISSWSDLSNAIQESYLVQATSEIDNYLYCYDIDSYRSTQGLVFPASYTIYDATGRDLGRLPVILRNAVCELAYYYISNEIHNDVNYQFSSVEMGDIKINYKDIGENITPDIPLHIAKMLHRICRKSNRSLLRVY